MKTFIVELMKSDPRLKLKKGERYNAIRYWLDPMDKVTLLSRIPDGWEPDCNEYKHNIKIITQDNQKEK